MIERDERFPEGIYLNKNDIFRVNSTVGNIFDEISQNCDEAQQQEFLAQSLFFDVRQGKTLRTASLFVSENLIWDKYRSLSLTQAGEINSTSLKTRKLEYGVGEVFFASFLMTDFLKAMHMRPDTQKKYLTRTVWNWDHDFYELGDMDSDKNLYLNVVIAKSIIRTLDQKLAKLSQIDADSPSISGFTAMEEFPKIFFPTNLHTEQAAETDSHAVRVTFLHHQGCYLTRDVFNKIYDIGRKYRVSME